MMTKGQIDRLGERLRSHPMDDRTLAELQEFRALYALPMLKAQGLIRQHLGLSATARLKTVNTTVEKLRRESTRLSQMQDVAGLRLVGDWYLTEQDLVVSKIAKLFENVKVQDRRVKPSQGYRAVHLIPTVDHLPIEIQVRTLQQDGWAQAMEKLADAVGRPVRYGGAPIRGGEDATMVVQRLLSFSSKIAAFEAFRNEVWGVKEAVSLVKSALPQLRPEEAKELEDWLDRMLAKIPEAEAKAEEISSELRAILAAMPRLHAMLDTEGSKQ